MVAKRRMADLGFSLLVVAFGVYVVVSGLQLGVGELRRIGPGFFPLVLGVAMAALGVASIFERPEAGEREPFNIYSLALVSAAVLSFALLVERLGLFPAIVALVLLTSLAGRERLSLRSTGGVILGLCAIGWLIFIEGLRLPLDAFVAPFAAGG